MLLWGIDARCWAAVPSETAAGGTAAGGTSRTAKAFSWGGLAAGGSSLTAPELAAGGSELGGEADDDLGELAAGGSELGGEADDDLGELAAGGSDLGGESTDVPPPARVPIGITTTTGTTITYTNVFVQPGDVLEVQWIHDGPGPLLIDWGGNGFTTVASTTLPGGGPAVGVSRWTATVGGTDTITVNPGFGASGLIAGAVKVTGLPSGTADGSATNTGTAPDPNVMYGAPLTGPLDYVGVVFTAWGPAVIPPSFGPVNPPYTAGQAASLTYGGNTYIQLEAHAFEPAGAIPFPSLTGSSVTDWAAATAAVN